ncbi:hypothetical protein ORJ04_05015 [Rheinheimera baltica]|uniref:Uncharacterized protein n=1 Tax=Rheinheimera baltica TaxID=67576 RepID=A0ABT9HW14_9GAMM|nr:hypothetical protein [Rheinheimera baltica]MDP5135311.1 hypothetical protein [Rheinheimera baltica]
MSSLTFIGCSISYEKYSNVEGIPRGYIEHSLGKNQFEINYYFSKSGDVKLAENYLKRRASEICHQEYRLSAIELRFPVSTSKLDYQWVHAKVECN